MAKTRMTAEQRRLAEASKGKPWRKWGPYLSERQWGTVREDYSVSGDAWSYFTHDHMLDENEFFGPYGIRALSRYHLEHPYVFKAHGEEFRVRIGAKEEAR